MLLPSGPWHAIHAAAFCCPNSALPAAKTELADTVATATNAVILLIVVSSVSEHFFAAVTLHG
jgi:hypothetical protein